MFMPKTTELLNNTLQSPNCVLMLASVLC
uniref:Uncharacterized protein n=1 Tax=Anguilla anguilla TaxID=7936 RepID=A0A0E9U7B0_ANGAN